MNRAEYIETCKKQAEIYFRENEMIVGYIREEPYRSRPEGMTFTPSQVQTIRTLLDVTGGKLSTSIYLSFVEMLLPEEDSAGLTKESFEVMRREWKWRRSPKVGVVVAYKSNGKFYLGWSLCHPGDEWNRYLGLNKAISTSLEWNDLLDGEISGESPMPYAVSKCVKNMVSRMNKCFQRSGFLEEESKKYLELV